MESSRGLTFNYQSRRDDYDKIIYYDVTLTEPRGELRAGDYIHQIIYWKNGYK